MFTLERCFRRKDPLHARPLSSRLTQAVQEHPMRQGAYPRSLEEAGRTSPATTSMES